MALKTERFILEPLNQSHVNAIYTLRSYPDIYKWTSSGRWSTIADSQAWIAKILASEKTLNYVVTLMPSTPVFFKTDDVPCLANGAFVIASLGITPDGEIGYIVHPDVWGFGVAKEAIRALVKTWFETLPNEKQVKACVDVTNVTSSGLLKKLGFVEAGREDYDSVEMGESVLITWLIANETAKNWKDSVKKD